MSPSRISVAIVEDSSEICENLVQMLQESTDFHCACVCLNARTAYRKIPPLNPDVVIMDIRLPDISGIECTAKLKRLLPNVSILMFTVAQDDEQIFKALEAGACGYLLKSSTTDELLEALRILVRGGAPMTDEIARKVIRSFQRSPNLPEGGQLTMREEEVLQLLARGLAVKEISSRLYISCGTVRNHLKNIYRKLHVRSRVEAVINYLEPNRISDSPSHEQSGF